MIYLFEGYDEVSEEQLAMLLEALPPARKEKALRFRYRNGQLSCAIGYYLFLYGYRKEFGQTDLPDFSIAENEKPYLADHPDIQFNISHCNRAVVCMMGRRPVGIDIQEVREVRDSFLDHICTEREKARIEHAPNPKLEFIRTWTQKEALSKYSGEGIFQNPKEISADHAPLDVMLATLQVAPDVFMTACSEVEDANFTVHPIRIEEIMNCIKENTNGNTGRM